MPPSEDIVVVKVGTNVVSRETSDGVASRLDQNVMADLARDISTIMEETGKRIILVSSGAVAAGKEIVDLDPTLDKVARKQAYAAIGQPRLMAEYADHFLRAKPPRQVAQLLVTRDNFDREAERRNIERTLHLLPQEVVPIVNENDTVATEELTLGDNDQLAAMIAETVKAQLLVLLTDVLGVFNGHPQDGRNHVMSHLPVNEITADFMERYVKEKRGNGGNGAAGNNGTGGMRSKLQAATRAARAGIPTVIASGKISGNLVKIVNGERVGTNVHPVAGPRQVLQSQTGN